MCSLRNKDVRTYKETPVGIGTGQALRNYNQIRKHTETLKQGSNFGLLLCKRHNFFLYVSFRDF